MLLFGLANPTKHTLLISSDILIVSIGSSDSLFCNGSIFSPYNSEIIELVKSSQTDQWEYFNFKSMMSAYLYIV